MHFSLFSNRSVSLRLLKTSILSPLTPRPLPPWRMSARAALSPRSSPSLLVALFLPLLSFPAFAQLSNKRLSLSLDFVCVRVWVVSMLKWGVFMLKW